MRYRAFRRKKDNLFYFQFLNESGDVLLNSQSYQDKEGCFNGIRSVLANAGDADRYEKSIDGDGKHFFILKAGNNQEIGRSVKYETEGAVDEAISTFISEGPEASSKSSKEESDSDAAKAVAASAPYEAGTRGSDDYRPLAFYEARISGAETGIDSFDADDGEFYFTYNLAGKPVLISEGYKTDKSRDNGANSVLKNLPISERYQYKVHPNGKQYFNLRAGNNQEIATSRWFDSAEAMESAIGLLQAGGSGSKDALVAAGLLPASANEKIYKDYKPLAFYEENIAGTDFGYDDFEKEDAHYFTINYDGGPVLISEDYTSAAGRDKGIASVKKNVKKEERYERNQHPNGKHYFNLRAGNNQEIATSRWFDSKKDMERAIKWLTSTGGTRRRKKASREKSAKERRYLKKNQAYLCNNITYDTFQSGGNEKFYFVFKNKEEKAVLINGDVRGFATEEDLDKGIQSVLKFGPKSDNYDVRTTKNGKMYFYIQNEDGKNVARSSLFYNTEADMKKAMALIQCVGAAMVGAGPGAAASSQKVVDDYLPCERYKAESQGFHKFQDEESKEHYFSYNDDEGEVLLRSEGYSSESARDNGIASVQKNAPLEERWTKGTALNDKYHYYALKAGNHQEIARSCYYEDEAAMLAALSGIQGEDSPIGFGSAMVGGALMSAGMLRFRAEEEKTASIKADEAAAATRAGEEARIAAEKKAEEEEEKAAAAALAAAAAAEEAARKKQEEEAVAKAEEEARIAAEKKAGEEKAAAAALAAAAAAKAAEAARRKQKEKAAAKAEEEARIAAEKKAGEEKAAAAALAAAAAAEAARRKQKEEAAAKAEEEARIAAEKKAQEEKAAAAALAAAAAAKAAEAARRKQEEEAAAAAAKAKAEEEEKATTAAAMAAAAAATAAHEGDGTAAAAYASGAGGSEKSGCMKWLIPAIIALLLLAALLYFLRGCEGCGTTPVIDDDTIETPIDTTPTEPEPEPEPFGKDGTEMGYDAGSLEYLMANHLSGAGSSYPSGRFDADDVTFSRNSARLNSAARKQLDNVIALLKEYPNSTIDIYGYITDNESGTGNKEVSLDDDRARAIYNYLKRGGIGEARMNFQGDGLGDRRGASFRILTRE